MRQSLLLLRGVCPARWLDKVEEEIHFIDHMFHGFVLGKLLDSAIIGVLCFLGCLALGLPMAPLISVVIGVTNIIPFVGPFIGAVPSAITSEFSIPARPFEVHACVKCARLNSMCSG